MKNIDQLFSNYDRLVILSIKRRTRLQRFGYFNALALGFIAALLILNVYSVLTVY